MMDSEFVQETNDYGSIVLIKRPKLIDEWNARWDWSELKIYPYKKDGESFPFLSIKDKLLHAYNHKDYKWFTIFSEIVEFLGCDRKTLSYHLNEIKKDGHLSYTEDRNEIDLGKKLSQVKIAQQRVIIVPYETFWALIEHYKIDLSKQILKELHRVDYKRMMEDENNQTLIEQIKGERSRDAIIREQLKKCETKYQRLAYSYIIDVYPNAKVEKWFYDKTNKKSWRVDIIIGKLKMVIEIDGKQHRFDDDRFQKDQNKDTFLLREGYYVLRRDNQWILDHCEELPQIIMEFIDKHKEKIQ